VIRWWLATIETTRADRRVAEQLSEVADLLESSDPPTMARVCTLLDQPRRQPRGIRPRRSARRPRTPFEATPSELESVGPRRELVSHALVLTFHLVALGALLATRPRSVGGGLDTVGFAVVWTLAAGGALVGAVSGIATLAGNLRDLPRVRRVAERTSVPWVRRAAASLATFGVSATSVATLAGGTSAPATEVTAVAHPRLPVKPTPANRPTTTSTTTTSTTSTTSSTSTTSTSSTTSVPSIAPSSPPDDAVPATAVALASTDEGLAAAPGTDAADDLRGVPPATWTVERGDHLWSIAERSLADRLGHTAAADEVLFYWQQLIEANRDRLVDPANPDLILVGQTFVLPTW
jgi:nucleoid-associated protein YgaU